MARWFKKLRKGLKKGLKSVAPVLRVASTASSFVPGVGTAVSVGLGAASAAASGKKLGGILAGAALNAVPGGGVVGAGVKAAQALGAAKALGAGRHLRALRAPDPAQLMRRPVSRPRLETISQGLARDVIARQPELMQYGAAEIARRTGLAPVTVSRAVRGPSLMWRGMSPQAAQMLQLLSAVPRGYYARDVAGLAPDGQTYTVEKGDYGVRIAQKLVGDGNRWRELKAANPKIAARPDPQKYGLVLYPGDVLQLPASWIKTAPLAAATVLKSKAILAAWGKTDGARASGTTDYGQRPEDAAETWGPRDRLQLASFAKWRGLADTSGNLTQAAADALHAWAEAAVATAPRPPVPQLPPPPVVVTPPTVPSLPPVVTPPALPPALPPVATKPPVVTVPDVVIVEPRPPVPQLPPPGPSTPPALPPIVAVPPTVPSLPPVVVPQLPPALPPAAPPPVATKPPTAPAPSPGMTSDDVTTVLALAGLAASAFML